MQEQITIASSNQLEAEKNNQNQQELSFMKAIYKQDWGKARQILKSTQLNVNSVYKFNSNGATILWWLAYLQQWEIVKEILATYTEANVNALPQIGPNKGITILWIAARYQQWEVVKEILSRHPEANVNAAHEDGDARGISVLWLAAYYQQWDIVEDIVTHFTKADTNAAPYYGKNKNRSVVSLITDHQQTHLFKQIYIPYCLKVKSEAISANISNKITIFNSAQNKRKSEINTDKNIIKLSKNTPDKIITTMFIPDMLKEQKHDADIHEENKGFNSTIEIKPNLK